MKLIIEVGNEEDIPVDEDPNWIRRELGRHLEDLVRERRRDQQDLHSGRQVAINVIYLLLESCKSTNKTYIEMKKIQLSS